MKLSELITFMKAALEGTNKEFTYYELVSDIQAIAEVLEGGKHKQLFWLISNKRTNITENGHDAADWQSHAVSYHTGYIITCNVDGTFAVKEL